jgi:Tfp pilus assembly protein PilO
MVENISGEKVMDKQAAIVTIVVALIVVITSAFSLHQAEKKLQEATKEKERLEISLESLYSSAAPKSCRLVALTAINNCIQKCKTENAALLKELTDSKGAELVCIGGCWRAAQKLGDAFFKYYNPPALLH